MRYRSTVNGFLIAFTSVECHLFRSVDTMRYWHLARRNVEKPVVNATGWNMKRKPIGAIAIRTLHTLRARLPSSRAATHRLKLALGVASVFVWTTLIPHMPAEAQTNAAREFDAAVLEAVGRDLGLSPRQAGDRMRAERATAGRARILEQALGAAYAGAWFDPTALELLVATTDPQKVSEIERNGARAVLVKRNMGELNGIHRRLDQGVLQLSQEQKRSIWEWGVDVQTNGVTITIPANDRQALLNAEDLITLSGADATAIHIRQSTQGPPTLFQVNNVRGGDRYTDTTDGTNCSVGFSVVGGYVTAGHCSGGTIGDNVVGYNGAQQGTFSGSQFPGEDRAWVAVNGNWAPSPCVGTGGNSNCATSPNVLIVGSIEAGVGHTVCRYGATTGGPHCGTIQALNQTVVFNGINVVNHLTRTSACSQPGDSGGPYVWNNHGQGTLTGGSTGNSCPSPGTSYFYPLNLTLTHFGLNLLTAGITETFSLTVGQCLTGSPYAQKGIIGFSPPIPQIGCSAPVGSLSPTVLSTGQQVIAVRTVAAVVTAVSSVSISGFASDPGPTWLLNVRINGTIIPVQYYSYSAGTASWGVSNSLFIGIPQGAIVTLTLVHQ